MASDAFNRANETPIASPWFSCVGGSANLGNNMVVAFGDAFCGYTNASSTADQYSQADWKSPPGGIGGPAVRVPGSGVTGLQGYAMDNSTPTFIKYVNGTFTDLPDTGSAAVDPGKITVVGSTIRGYMNGVEVANGPVTDTSISGGGEPGLFVYDSSNGMDNWSGGDVSIQALAPRRDFPPTRFGPF